MEKTGFISIISDTRQYWKIYFDVGYFFQLVPFRLVRNTLTGDYILRTNPIQQIFCAALMIPSVALFILAISQIEGREIKGLVTYSTFGNVLAIGTYYFAFNFTVWWKQTHVEKVIDFLQRNPLVCCKANRSRMNGLGAYVCTGLTILIAVYTYWNTFRQLNSDKLRQHGANICFLPVSVVENDCVTHWFCVTLYLITYTHQYFMMYYCDLFVFITVMLFRNIVNNFLLSARNIRVSKIFEEYIQLRKLVENINEVVGVFTFLVAVAGLPFYTRTIGSILNKPESIKKHNTARVLLYLIYIFSMLLIAGDCAKKIRNVKYLFQENQKYLRVTSAEMSLFLSEIDSNSVSLSGYGLFNITIELLGSIIGTLITYGFLLAQLKAD